MSSALLQLGMLFSQRQALYGWEDMTESPSCQISKKREETFCSC